MKVLVSIALVALTAITHAQTGGGSSTAESTVSDFRAVYRWSNAAQSYKPYHESIGQVEVVTTSTGVIASPRTEMSRENLQWYFDGDGEMSQFMNLSTDLETMQFIYTVVIGQPIRFHETVVSDIVLTKGTREGYLAGETIEFVLPPESAREMDSLIAIHRAREFGAAARAGLAQTDPVYADLKVSGSIDLFELEDNVYSADLDEIRISTSHIRVRSTMTLSF